MNNRPQSQFGIGHQVSFAEQHNSGIQDAVSMLASLVESDYRLDAINENAFKILLACDVQFGGGELETFWMSLA